MAGLNLTMGAIFDRYYDMSWLEAKKRKRSDGINPLQARGASISSDGSGRPDRVIVRPFTRGIPLREPGAFENILGENVYAILTGADAEDSYKEGKKYRPHYMAACEAHNAVKATGAGLDGNPNQFRDFVIKPCVYALKTQDQEGRCLA